MHVVCFCVHGHNHMLPTGSECTWSHVKSLSDRVCESPGIGGTVRLLSLSLSSKVVYSSPASILSQMQGWCQVLPFNQLILAVCLHFLFSFPSPLALPFLSSKVLCFFKLSACISLPSPSLASLVHTLPTCQIHSSLSQLGRH